MVPFDVKSLFISVPLTEAICIILNHVYNRKETSTLSTKNKIKKLLILRTKNVHFTLNNEMKAMKSRIGPHLAYVFMGELENKLVPRLHQDVKKWRRSVDDTFAYVKNEYSDYVLKTLNSFHPNISFTYEKENTITYQF